MAKLSVSHIDSQSVSPEEIEIYRALRPFIARCLNLNHDLNNPLAGIIGYAEFLQDEAVGLNPEQKELLNQVLIATERLRTIIDKISEMKVALGEKIDLKQVTEAYSRLERTSD